MTECECDRCRCEILPGAAQADGYCPFCASACFPLAVLPDGRTTRVVFTSESREALHAAAEVAELGVEAVSPLEEALDSAVDALAKAALPSIDRLVRRGVRRLFR